MVDSCPFCERAKEEILYESRNFFVTPGLGQLVEGYLLICSKEHFIGLSGMPLEYFDEFLDVQEKVRGVLSRKYCNPIFFEHGAVSRARKGGCCIDHSHLHAVPANVDIYSDIERHFTGRRIESIKEIKEQLERQKSYFYYENQEGEKFVFELNESVPSQYLRQVLAVRLGTNRWDWRIHPEYERFNRTLERLRGLI